MGRDPMARPYTPAETHRQSFSAGHVVVAVPARDDDSEMIRKFLASKIPRMQFYRLVRASSGPSLVAAQ